MLPPPFAPAAPVVSRVLRHHYRRALPLPSPSHPACSCCPCMCSLFVLPPPFAPAAPIASRVLRRCRRRCRYRYPHRQASPLPQPRSLDSTTVAAITTVLRYSPALGSPATAMGRAPCCDRASVKRGPWSPEEDITLKNYVEKHGTGGNWIALPQKAELLKELWMEGLQLRKPMWQVVLLVLDKEWPEEDYPPYANGPGYIISSDIAHFVVSEFEKHTLRGEPSFHLFGFIMCVGATAARALKSVLQGILLSSEG